MSETFGRSTSKRKRYSFLRHGRSVAERGVRILDAGSLLSKTNPQTAAAAIRGQWQGTAPAISARVGCSTTPSRKAATDG